MLDKLTEALRFQQEALSLRDQRHQVLAANIANADTPGYKARDFDFASELRRAMGGGDALPMATTAPGHLPAAAVSVPRPELLYRVPEQPSLDGNTVDMERERVHFADNAVRYQASLTLLKASLRGLENAMQPE